MFKSSLISALLALALVGCRSTYQGGADPFRGRNDMWSSQAARQDAVYQALIVQRTIYAYHFETGSSRLNALGERDLRILADHYKSAPGSLNVKRGDAEASLYEARVQSVAQVLADAGLADRVEILDARPGGEGMATTRVNEVLAREQLGSAASTISESLTSSDGGSN